MLLVSDVHGAFDALAVIARSEVPLIITGDLLNFIDYRTCDGIVADVMGRDFVADVVAYRMRGDYEASRALWRSQFADRRDELRGKIIDAVHNQYREAAAALEGAQAYVTYGNVDWPDLLAEVLPAGVRFVDGEVVDIEGARVGIVGGGSPTPLGVPGEVSEDDMRTKLGRLGQVDVLCTHVPPDVPALRRDVITGRIEGGSRAVLEYIEEWQPPAHYFGDVHQPQALRWRVGSTVCRNVGYFRATRRPVRHFAGYACSEGSDG